jgi:hypothetical protein
VTRLGITPRRCFSNSQGDAIPAAVRHCVARPVSAPNTVPPAPIRLTCRTLKGGSVRPSKIFYVLMEDHAVTSGRWDRASPSLSALCGHRRHCCTTPCAVATPRRCWGVRGQDLATTTTVPRTGFPSTAPSSWPTTAAGQPTTTPQPLKPLLCEHRTHHDTLMGEGFARTTVSSTTLFAIPLHVLK